MQPAFLKDLEARYLAFTRWLAALDSQVKMESLTAVELDLIALEYLDEKFFDGEHVGTVEKLPSALRFLHPGLGRGSTKSEFPRCSRALRGWMKIDPGRMRLPMPKEAVMLCFAALVHRRAFLEATAFMI